MEIVVLSDSINYFFFFLRVGVFAWVKYGDGFWFS